MAIDVIARILLRDGKRQGNCFRFMPGRTTSAKNVFRSLSYVRGLTNVDGGQVMNLGAVIGPNREISGNGDEVIIDPNTKIIPIHSTSQDDLIKIRPFFTEEEKKKPVEKRRAKNFIDFATFKEMAPGDVQLVKYLGEPKVNLEVWTGMFETMTEEMYQLLYMLNHGSIAYSGGRNVVKAKKSLIDPNAPESEQKIARQMARMLYEDHGDLFNGVPIWSVRTWEMEYSPKDSEIVMARHFNMFYVIEVEKAEAVKITRFTDSDAKKWERRFLKDFNAQLVAEKVRADIEAGIAQDSAA